MDHQLVHAAESDAAHPELQRAAALPLRRRPAAVCVRARAVDGEIQRGENSYWAHTYKVKFNAKLTLVCFVIHQEFRKMSFSGYVLNGEQDNFFYMSLSRLHPQRNRTATGASGNESVPAGAPAQEATQEKETESQPTTAENEVNVEPTSRSELLEEPGLICLFTPCVSILN